MRRPSLDTLNEPFDADDAPKRYCQVEGCFEVGDYRAPVSRDRLEDYYWFCLDHVRTYNKAWDYFAGMNEAEIEAQRRADTTWQRPSWPLGRSGERAEFGAGYRIHDGFGFFTGDEAATHRPRPQSEEQRALAVLDLEAPVTFEDVKSRYKTLVKVLHPDANGCDPEAEERLKAVNQAYAALKVSFA